MDKTESQDILFNPPFQPAQFTEDLGNSANKKESLQFPITAKIRACLRNPIS